MSLAHKHTYPCGSWAGLSLQLLPLYPTFLSAFFFLPPSPLPPSVSVRIPDNKSGLSACLSCINKTNNKSRERGKNVSLVKQSGLRGVHVGVPRFLNPSAVVGGGGGRAASSGRRQQHPLRHLPLGGSCSALLCPPACLPACLADACWTELGGAAAASLRDGSTKKAG